ncbi:FecR family protein [Brevundimonas sp.]|uniref:FecR family protein n=1 Tax=Brevundimonas sp. TaxID=1871086 RepID=UPI003D0A33B1
MTTTLLHDQALDWFVRLSDPDAPETAWIDFQTWLEASPANGHAYDLIEQVWVALDEETPAGETEAPPLVANDAWPEPRARRDGHGKRPGRVWLPSLAMAAAALMVVGLWPEISGTGRFQTFSTADASRELVLSDGSRLTMNRHSDLRVRIGKHDREVALTGGEVAFDVTHDAARPFTVAAGDHEVRVLGTAFNVLSHNGEFSVGVRRGLVAVSGNGIPETVRLAVGQRIDQTGEAAPVVVRVDPDQTSAWQQGVLVYRNTDLDSVADDLSRYLDKPVKVEASAGALKFTGALRIGDEATMLRQLQEFVPIRVTETAGGLHMEARDGR